MRLAVAPRPLPPEIVYLRPRARRRGTSGMMSVARGIVGPRTGLRLRARSGRPRGTEFDATEWEQIPVEILRAVEHQTVARASDQRGHRRGKGEHAPFGRYHAYRPRPP